MKNKFYDKNNSGSNCQKLWIVWHILPNICQTQKIEKTQLDIEFSGKNNAFVNKVMENTPISRSDRIAKLKDCLIDLCKLAKNLNFKKFAYKRLSSF